MIKEYFSKNIYFDRAYLCQNTYLSQDLTLCQTPFLYLWLFRPYLPPIKTTKNSLIKTSAPNFSIYMYVVKSFLENV